MIPSNFNTSGGRDGRPEHKRDDGEMKAGQPQGGQPHRDAGRRCHQQLACGHRCPERPVRTVRGSGGKCADRHEDAVGERDLAAVAGDDVQPPVRDDPYADQPDLASRRCTPVMVNGASRGSAKSTAAAAAHAMRSSRPASSSYGTDPGLAEHPCGRTSGRRGSARAQRTACAAPTRSGV